jgi:hypothetical protein
MTRGLQPIISGQNFNDTDLINPNKKEDANFQSTHFLLSLVSKFYYRSVQFFHATTTNTFMWDINCFPFRILFLHNHVVVNIRKFSIVLNQQFTLSVWPTKLALFNPQTTPNNNFYFFVSRHTSWVSISNFYSSHKCNILFFVENKNLRNYLF